MKIVQSFWSKPFIQSDPLLADARLNGGWPHRVVNYYSWALSCLQLRKFYSSVELVTDRLGKEILVDKLKLPYSSVIVTLDDLDNYHEGLWAVGKLYTYGLQKEPFLHVDGDIFIWSEFGNEIHNAHLVAQNLEPNIEDAQKAYEYILQKLPYRPGYFEAPDDREFGNCCNAGILGGNDISFLREYVEESFLFLEKNWTSINESLVNWNVGHLNAIFEQIIFYSYAKFRKADITYMFPEENKIPQDIGYFHAAHKNKNFVHCLGTYKTMRVSYSSLEWKLKQHYPDYYDRITELVETYEI